jgi:putative membrane protein
MSPLARVATLAAITIGTAAAVAGPAAAQPSSPESPSSTAPNFAPVSPSAEPSGSAAAPAESATASGSSVVSTQDSQYLRQAHQTNLAEISAGNLAQQKGNSQTVKNLGAKFVTDHTRLDQELKSVAQTLGVSLPQAPNANQQAVASRLKATSGSSFDTLFVTTQLTGHTQAMQAGQTEIANGSNPRAIMVARDSAPVIASHHEALESAARTLNIPLSATPRSSNSVTAPVSPRHSVHS